MRRRLSDVPPLLWSTLLCATAFAVLFGALAVRNHQLFATWTYDLGIYDQATWLLSRGGRTFMSVRGLDVWGHHVNPILYVFVPAYWLGAGPRFLVALQAGWIAIGAVPVHFIAKHHLGSDRWGFGAAVVFLVSAPLEWLTWDMFHPEALVVTPLLFAWWFATRERWGWCWVALLLALCTREDAALVVGTMAISLAVVCRPSHDRRRLRRHSVAMVVVAIVWWLMCVQVVIPHFNGGRAPFYVSMFYGQYGNSVLGVLVGMVRHPTRVLGDLLRPDRRWFVWRMLMPFGLTALASPLALLPAMPQLLASLLGASPYPRQIEYQYTSMMIAPIAIAAIRGVSRLRRLTGDVGSPALHARRRSRLGTAVPIVVAVAAVVSNVMWSPSPLRRDSPSVWVGESASASARRQALSSAVALVSPTAGVVATYAIGAHLAHRTHLYDWPNPFVPTVWGNGDCTALPDPREVEYAVLEYADIGTDGQVLFEAMTRDGGPFRVLASNEYVVVLQRVGTSAEVDVTPRLARCQTLEGGH